MKGKLIEIKYVDHAERTTNTKDSLDLNSVIITTRGIVKAEYTDQFNLEHLIIIVEEDQKGEEISHTEQDILKFAIVKIRQLIEAPTRTKFGNFRNFPRVKVPVVEDGKIL